MEDAWVIAQHIEVSDADIDDTWLAREFIEEMMTRHLSRLRPTPRRSSMPSVWKATLRRNGSR